MLPSRAHSQFQTTSNPRTLNQVVPGPRLRPGWERMFRMTGSQLGSLGVVFLFLGDWATTKGT
jgi:hypothetical protein